MIGHLAAVRTVVQKEILEHFRSKRIFIIGGIFAATFVLTAFAAFAFVEEVSPGEEAGQEIATILAFYYGAGFLFFFGGYSFTSVLGIVLSADAIVGEWKDRTLFLLFSKPVSRHAVLAGKVMAAYASVLLVVTAVFGLGILVLLFAVGLPDAAGWGRILGGLGIVALGILPFVALGIFCSTLLRTPATSFVVALGLWLVALPILGRLGEIILFIQRKPFEAFQGSDLVEFFHYLDPMNLLQSATIVWLSGSEELPFFVSFSGIPENTGLVALAMVVHTVVYLAASFFILARRDYA